MTQARLSQRLEALAEGVQGFLRAQKAAYDAGTRFLKMRVWIVGALLLDLVLTLACVWLSSRAGDVEVWFEPGFPSNMLVVKNLSGAPLPGVTLILDGRYRLEVDRVDEGPNGFEVSHAFRDPQDAAPADTYRPARLELRFDGRALHLPIADRAKNEAP